MAAPPLLCLFGARRNAVEENYPKTCGLPPLHFRHRLCRYEYMYLTLFRLPTKPMDSFFLLIHAHDASYDVYKNGRPLPVGEQAQASAPSQYSEV